LLWDSFPNWFDTSDSHSSKGIFLAFWAIVQEGFRISLIYWVESEDKKKSLDKYFSVVPFVIRTTVEFAITI